MWSLLPDGLFIQGHLTGNSIPWSWFQWSFRTGGSLIRVVAVTGFTVTVSGETDTTPHQVTSTQIATTPHQVATVYSLIQAPCLYFFNTPLPRAYNRDRAYIGDRAYIFSTNISIQSQEKYMTDIMHATQNSTPKEVPTKRNEHTLAQKQGRYQVRGRCHA